VSVCEAAFRLRLFACVQVSEALARCTSLQSPLCVSESRYKSPSPEAGDYVMLIIADHCCITVAITVPPTALERLPLTFSVQKKESEH